MKQIDIARKPGANNELLEAEDELSSLEAVFQNTPDPYGELLHRLGELESNIASFRVAVASHWQKLPPELLCEIFLFCTPLPAALPPKVDETLLQLTQVCRSWRELALQVPELWASISVVFDAEGLDVQRITSTAKQWLSRAGTTYPLSITAACTGTYANVTCESPDLVSGFIPLVLSYAHRLKHFDLSFPIATLLPLFQLPPASFPCLEVMCLRPLLLLRDMSTPESGYQGWHWPSNTTAFDSAPSIQQITYSPTPLFKLADLEAIVEDVMERAMSNLDVGGHPFFAPTISLPWSQLTVISFPFTALTPDVWCSILIQCPELEHCEVAIKPSPIDPLENARNSSERIRLEYLHYLSVSAFSGGGDELLDNLIAPRLDLFILMGVQFGLPAFLDFQARSNFVLKTFIPVVQIATDDVELLFQHLSDIQTLVILAISTEHFPLSFWGRVGRMELLPHLETLLIRPTANQAACLVDMISARWEDALAGGTGLVVGFCDVRPSHLPAVNDELKRLEKYAEGGRAVEVITVC